MDLPLALPETKKIAAFFLLPDCDLRCRFCIAEARFDTVDLPTAKSVLTALAATSIESVVLGGGEPTLWPHDLNALARHGRAHGLIVQLNTHGGSLREKLDSYPEIDRFILPIESTDPAHHDDLRRGQDGHFQAVVAALESLIERQRQITFSTVVTSENHLEVPRIAAWIQRLESRGARIHAWHLYNFLPLGRAGAQRRAAALALPREDFLEACRLAKSAGLTCAVYRREDMMRSSSVEFFWFDGGVFHVGGQQRDLGELSLSDTSFSFKEGRKIGR